MAHLRAAILPVVHRWLAQLYSSRLTLHAHIFKTSPEGCGGVILEVSGTPEVEYTVDDGGLQQGGSVSSAGTRLYWRRHHSRMLRLLLLLVVPSYVIK